MAEETSSYQFEVEADIAGALESFDKLDKKANQVMNTQTKSRDNNFSVNQKDMDKSMRNMQQLTNGYERAQKELESLKESMADMGDEQGIKKVDAALTGLERKFTQVSRAQKEMSRYQQTASKQFQDMYDPRGMEKYSQAVKDTMASTEQVKNGVRSAKEELADLKRLDRRTESLANSGKNTGYMSFQQSQKFDGDYDYAKTTLAQRASESKETLSGLESQRSTAMERRESLISSGQGSTKEKQALDLNIQEINKEIESRQNLVSSTEEVIRKLDRRMADLEGVEEKPERGTTKGMIYERAPAIGLAAGAAMIAPFASLYSQGSGLKSEVRDDVVGIGTRTGAEDFRADVRQNAGELGLENNLGVSTAEMIAFQDTYLANSGLLEAPDTEVGQAIQQEDMNTAMQSQAVFSRSTGTSVEDTADFFNTAFGAGGGNADSVKMIQDGFLGAMESSGMIGREKEQLSALQSIIDVSSRGRDVSDTDVRNLMGLQSALANTGERSLQGEQGAELMTSLDEGIRSSFHDPKARMMFGMGLGDNTGVEGLNEVSERMDRGLSDPDNLQGIMDTVQGMSPGDTAEPAHVRMMAAQMFGTDISHEQAAALSEAHQNGELSAEGISSIIDDNETIGADKAMENLGLYQNQDEATENQYDATQDKMAMNMNDWGDIVREAGASLNGLPAPAYAAIAGLAALASALSFTAASFGGSAVIRKAASGKRNRNGSPNPDSKGTSPGGTAATAGAATAGTMVGTGTKGASTDKGRATAIPNPNQSGGQSGTKQPNNPVTPMGILPGNQGETKPGGGGKMGKMMGGNLPMMAMMAAMTAPSLLSMDGAQAAETGGGMLGGMGGFMGGAKLGGLAGSVFGPVGTGVGALVGGTVGSLAGSSVGSSIGGMFGGDSDAPTEEDIYNQFMTNEAISESGIGATDMDSMVSAAITENEDDPQAALKKLVEARGEEISDKQADQLVDKHNDQELTPDTMKEIMESPEGMKETNVFSSGNEIAKSMWSLGVDAEEGRGSKFMNNMWSLGINGDKEDKEEEELTDEELAEVEAEGPKEESSGILSTAGNFMNKLESASPLGAVRYASSKLTEGTKGLFSPNTAEAAELEPTDDVPVEVEEDKGIMSRITSGVSSAASTVGGWASNLLGPSTASAAEATDDDTMDVPETEAEGTNDLEGQVDRESTDRKDKTEQLREENIRNERGNLNLLEQLLTRAESIVAQGGLMGNGDMPNASGSAGAGGGADGTSLTGSDNEEQIFNYLQGKGFSAEAASGIIGNLQQESGLDPKAKQANGPGRGIMQWSEGERWKDLQNWAGENGRDEWDLGTQLDFMMLEMEGRETTGANILNNRFGGLEGLKGMNDTKKAADAFEQSFERAGRPKMQQRYNYANETLGRSKNYREGGIVKHDHTARVGEEGKEEMFIPLQAYNNQAHDLITHAIHKTGYDIGQNNESGQDDNSSTPIMSQNTEPTQDIYSGGAIMSANSLGSSQGSSGGPGGNVTLNANVSVTVQDSGKGVRESVNHSQELKDAGRDIAAMLTQPLDYYSKDMKLR